MSDEPTGNDDQPGGPDDLTIDEWATKPKHRLSHLSRMAGNIACGLVASPQYAMYDKASRNQIIAEDAVAIAEAVVDELVRVEKARSR